MITQTVNLHTFKQAFASLRPDNFTSEGLDSLFVYLDDMSDGLELDVIALCCEYNEYANIDEYNKEYGTCWDDRYDLDEITCTVGEHGFICYEH